MLLVGGVLCGHRLLHGTHISFDGGNFLNKQVGVVPTVDRANLTVRRRDCGGPCGPKPWCDLPRYTAQILPSNRPVLIVSPHLDDAVLSAFSLLRGAARVVNVFTGAPLGLTTDWDRDRGFSDAASHMVARLIEEQAVMDSLGVQHIELGFLPVEYRTGPMPAEKITTAVMSHVRSTDIVALPVGAGGKFSLATKLKHRLQPARRPPGGTTPHLDHLAVTDLLTGALLTAGHDVVLYEEVPYLWAGKGDQRAIQLADQHGCAIEQFPQSVDRAAKGEAINGYFSQAGAVILRRPDQIAEALPEHEWFWRLIPR